MAPLSPGLYEQVINEAIAAELNTIDMLSEVAPIDPAESAGVLAKYVSDILEKGLEALSDKKNDLQSQILLTNRILELIAGETGRHVNGGRLPETDRAEQLLALLEKTNTLHALYEKERVVRPETSLAQSSLFTGAVHEPSLFTELKREIQSCDRIDMLVSFIKWSGLRLIIDELRDFTGRGGVLRVITTSYMGATDIKAVEELFQLTNTEIKVSYDTRRTRLHAKAYIFYRNTGFTTAYIGSSNLSNSAISSGLEWNVKVTARDQPATLRKIEATFESYLNSSEFENYTNEQKPKLERALKTEKWGEASADIPYLFDIRPYPFQQEILDNLEAERTVRGRFKNLIVSATGTGKTVISGLDYKRFKEQNSKRPCRMLFVAHREEILRQSLSCFRGVLRDPNFGDLFVGDHRPDTLDHLFISVQTFHSQQFETKTSPDFYDYIVVDEFHHAAAPTYQKLFTHYRPKILLGLTATPERMDGKIVLEYFDNKIAAEIRLPEAIDRKLLSPFQYFGVTDTVDLNDLRWVRGGYQVSDLDNVYVLNRSVAKNRAAMIVKSIIKYVTDMNDVKGLGFCVSVEHAKFMAEFFNNAGIPSMCLVGQSPDEERAAAKNRLVSGKIRFIFVVNIYNEGVDIPEVNTVLFLRPTESLTVFLQQLGRGLRLSEGKECLTILDFIGQANKRYNFEEKFAALLSNTSRSVQKEVKDGFVSLPKGCYIQLERKAKEYILDNIKSAFGARTGLLSRIASFEEDSGLPLTLANFVDYYHLDPRIIYRHHSFYRLCANAGVKKDFSEPMEEVVTKAFSRICAIDSRRWISFLLEKLPVLETVTLSDDEEAMLRMLQFTIWQKSFNECGFQNLKEGFIGLKSNPVLFSELMELLRFNYDRIDFIDEKLDLPFPCPLDVHCTYTRDQILSALGFLKPSTVREGVKYLEEISTDLLFVTLNKSDKDYSPTTMYKDYSINEWLFHWQSQSTTAETSPTGQRYIGHKKQGSFVMLFVRESKTDITGASPYTFLGLADYVSHEGSRPMSITWKLHKAIPAKFLKKTNQLMAS
jgi:superfamily II DNA or RNA helicase